MHRELLTEKGGLMKKMISTLGIDLAKNTFQLCALTRRGEVIFNKKVARGKIFSEIEKFDKADDFLIAMEACGGANHMARSLMGKGI